MNFNVKLEKFFNFTIICIFLVHLFNYYFKVLWRNMYYSIITILIAVYFIFQNVYFSHC